MADLYHAYGSDLVLGAPGGILLASGAILGTQRVLRRLLTNPGDLLFHPNYGAGLGRFVGQPVDPQRITGIVLQQMRFESVVATTPAPTVSVSWTATGDVFLDISYTDAATQVPQILQFSVGPAGATITQAGPA